MAHRQLRDRPLRTSCLFLLSVSLPVGAELVVIDDSGQTRPLAPLLQPLLPQGRSQPDSTPSEREGLPPSSRLGAATLSNLLPVRSPALRVGELDGRPLAPAVLARLALGNPRPFFLVGADAVSLRWLAQQRSTLQALGAVGLLVQADSADDVRQVADVAQGLPVTLGSGDDLARELGLDRYPVLVTREGIRQ